HALHLADEDDTVATVAVELAQHYAQEAPFSFRQPKSRRERGEEFTLATLEQGVQSMEVDDESDATVARDVVPDTLDAAFEVAFAELLDDPLMEVDEESQEDEPVTDEVGDGAVRTALDAAFEAAFDALLGDDADGWERNLGAAFAGEDGQNEDYLLFEDGDSSVDGPADEQALRGGDAGDDVSVRSVDSWSSGVSAMSMARELTVAGLRELERAADSEAERWYTGQTEQTGESVRRRRGELLGSWGPDATAYPVLVDHLRQVVRGDAPPKETNVLLMLLSLTPRGLAVPVEQLGTWLKPQRPPTGKEILPQLGKLHSVYPEVALELGVRKQPPGEESGERRASVLAELSRLSGLATSVRGRLTARAVTVLGSWAVELGYRQAVSQARAK
ncbi:hypothetical protein, partial [Streptomyces wedmorensis]|uniref:hypothetical protein n=1 Tax=Streptomyces wedmorensis TaxID=43759 RepID=UPI0037B80B73